MMIRKLPVIATIIVAAAILVMIGLGIWQAGRAQQKEAALATWRGNMDRPATAYPASHSTDEQYLFRQLSANCLRVTGWQEIGGRDKDGKTGWRHIASCATGAEGPGLIVDMGVSAKPNLKVDWQGGLVRGIATHEPDNSSWVARLMGDSVPLRLMIVADTPAPGLTASAPPDPSSVPNNHRAYMWQWFFFAIVAAIIYGLALRARWKDQSRKDSVSRNDG